MALLVQHVRDRIEHFFAAVAANLVLAGPTSGADAAPTFRALVAADLAAHGHTVAGDGGVLANPVVTTTIKDTNGNPWLGVGAIASAVNYWKVTNAATGGKPKLSLVGDANQSAQIQMLGTGDLEILDGPSNVRLRVNDTGLIDFPNQSLIKATMASNQSISASTFTTLDFSTENTDRLGEYTPSTKTFVPATNGVYAFFIAVESTGFTAADRVIVTLSNGSPGTELLRLKDVIIGGTGDQRVVGVGMYPALTTQSILPVVWINNARTLVAAGLEMYIARIS